MGAETTQETACPVAYWSCDPDTERLTAVTITEAVAAWADDIDGPLPETVTVYGYARMEPDVTTYVDRYLTWLVEALDEEYGDPEAGVYTKPTEGMREAARTCVRAVLAEYKPWACEEVTRRDVRVRDYYDETEDES